MPSIAPLNPFTQVNDEVTRYFESLGFEVSWDFSRRSGEYWYEISKDGELLAQIDMGVPLPRIIGDMLADARGDKWSEGSDYKVSAPTKTWKRLRDRVVKHQKSLAR